jgi:hypothetical protein
MVPERDSSLYDCFNHSQSHSILSATSVPNLSSIRCNSNSSSNEADEETSLSSMNSNQINPSNNSMEDNEIGIYMTPGLSMSTTNMSTFKTAIPINLLPSKPSEVKRRSNHRKQIYAAINSNNNPLKIIENENSVPPPPPPPPPPTPPPPPPEKFDAINKVEPMNDFQIQIEQAKTRLKKINPEKSIKSIPSSQPFLFLEFKLIILSFS